MSQSRLGRIFVALVLLLSFGGWAVAQSNDTQTPPPPQQSQPSQDNSQQNPQDQKKEKKEKKKKKKEKSQDVVDSETFSDGVARYVLDNLRDGLEGHSVRLFESAFDDDKMDGYLTFEDQVEAMFQQYSEFRVHFKIAQTTTEGPKGVILVDIEMEEIPNASPTARAPQPQRRNGQVRFELERGKKGWRIVDFSPRSFFS
jgi:hypothetical protein